MAGLTPEGLTVLRLPEVVEELRDKAREIWADTVPEGEVVNVEDNSAIGRQIGVVAPSGANLWEAVQQVYDAFNPNTAVGVALDNIVALGGITRIPSSPTRATCLVTGSTNTVIPANSRVTSSTTNKMYSTSILTQLSKESATGVGVSPITTSNSTVYSVLFRKAGDIYDVNITITTPSNGTTLFSIYSQFQNLISTSFPTLKSRISGDVLYIESVDPFQLLNYSSTANLSIVKVIKPIVFTAEDVGPVVQPSDTINTIATPVLGWDSVTNPFEAATGSFIETDNELRERFRNSKFDRATSVIESLYTAILSVQGITDLRIYENDTGVIDSNGVLGHSFLTIVDGGLSTSIAQAIWDNKPVGILSQGNTTVTVVDSQGLPHDVNFSRPVDVTIYIEIELSTTSQFPPNGEELIKDALISYMRGLKIGDDVVYSRLYTPINSVPGHQVNSLKISTSPSPTGTSNVAIDFDKLAVTDYTVITFV